MSAPDRGLVQPILVGPTGSHLEVIEAVMISSTLHLIEHHHDPSVVKWLDNGFTKSVRHVNATKLSSLLDPSADPSPCVFQVGAACAASFTPMAYDDFPPLLRRARVSGLERERRDMPRQGRMEGVVFLNAELGMTTGKAAAQAAHALNVWALGQRNINDHDVLSNCVREVDAELFDLACGQNPQGVIHDAGHTEIEAGSATAVWVDGYSAMQWVQYPIELTGADADRVLDVLARHHNTDRAQDHE